MPTMTITQIYSIDGPMWQVEISGGDDPIEHDLASAIDDCLSGVKFGPKILNVKSPATMNGNGEWRYGNIDN